MEESVGKAKGSDSRANGTSSEEGNGRKGGGRRPRRTPEELEFLEVAYSECEAPNEPQRQAIADELGISFKQVSCWFQNKRQKERKKQVAGGTECFAKYSKHTRTKTDEKDQMIAQLEQENQFLRYTLERTTHQLEELQKAAQKMIEEYHREKDNSTQDCMHTNIEPMNHLTGDQARLQSYPPYHN
eukprot:scaffold800_cov327-Pavlova_lutheri.AAC.9